MSDSVQPHRRQPTRLPRPWDSPGKNTGVGCHFLLQCMKVKSESEVAQSCPTLSDLMDCSLTGSSVRGIFQARVLEWGAITFSISLSPEKMKYRTLFGTSVNRNNLDTFQFSSCLSQGYCLHRRRGLEVPSPFPEHLLRFYSLSQSATKGSIPYREVSGHF